MSEIPTELIGKYYKRIVAEKLSTQFRDTKIESVQFPENIPNDHIIVKIKYTAINASDVNYIAGKYDPNAKPPLYPGFEAVGNVIAVGKLVTKYNIGDPVAITGNGCFSEYSILPASKVSRVPFVSPQILPLIVSGLTAAIGLYEVGQMKSSERVLITAAAGATGTFAVQLAKQAGNHVIGTCSSDEKVEYLKKLGCNRVINYKKEDLHRVLKKEYPKGINLIYESVGGDTFETCVNNLAIKGRLIIVGFISKYQDGSGWSSDDAKGSLLPAKLISKSASIRGFFLMNYASEFKKYTEIMTNLIQEGRLESKVDEGRKFVGLEQVVDALDYMYQGKNIGKIVVELPESNLIKSKL